MATIATLVVKVMGDTSSLKSSMTGATQDVKRSVDSLTSFGSALTAGVTLPLLGLGAAALKGAADQEQLQIAFTTMLGSAEKAKTLIQQLQTFAAATPFEMPEVVSAGKQLLAFGISAEQIQPTLTMLGDVASGIGAPIGDLAYLFGTASASGRLMTADINQFANRGIPIISALAAVMGVAESSVRDLAAEGKVTSVEMTKAFQYMTSEGSQFGGMMEKQSVSLAGMASTIKDNLGQALTVLGVQIIQTFGLSGAGGVMERFLNLTGQMKDGIANFAQAHPELFKLAIIFGVVAASIGPLLLAVGGLVTAFSAGGILATGVTAIATIFGALLSPIGLLVAAVGLLAAAIYNDWGGIGTFAVSVWGMVVAAVQPLITILGTMGEYFRAVVEDGDYLNDFLGNLPPAIQPVVQGVGQFLSTLLDIPAAIGATVQGLEHYMRTGELLSASEFGVTNSVARMADAFTELGADVIDATQMIATAVSTLLSGEDFTALQTNVTAALEGIGTAVRDYFSGDISLGGLAGAVSQGFADIGTAISSFFGGADFGTFLSDIQWNEFIEKLTWENFLTVIRWEDFVTMLGDWGTWISTLDWTSIITMGIDWAMWIPALTWTAFVNVLDWELYLVPLAWDAFVDALNWLDATGEKINWSDYISMITWDNFISVLQWSGYILAFAWSSFIDKLEWSGAIDKMSDWGAYISQIDWTAFIVQLLDWATWIPAFVWNSFIDVINWVDYVVNLIWGDWVPSLNWSEFVPAAFAWGDYVLELAWNKYVPAMFSWASYVFSLVWSQFVPAAFAWSSYVFSLTWSNFVSKLQWPSLSWPGWSAFVPSFPGWPDIGGMISGMIPDFGGNAIGTDFWRGGMTWVGEAGPELVYLPRGTGVKTASESRKMGSDGGGMVIEAVYVQDEMDAYTMAYKLDDLRKRRERR